MLTTTQCIERQIEEYAKSFLKAEYGEEALRILNPYHIVAVDEYDGGGVSEVTDTYIKIAAKRDIDAGKLTGTTKLIVRHELGHILDTAPTDYPEFQEQILREKTAWANAKPKTAAEHWYKAISIRTHLDPLKMQAIGFPRPERKVDAEQLKMGVEAEKQRMGIDSAFVDEGLAERFAMANLVENPNYYGAINGL